MDLFLKGHGDPGTPFCWGRTLGTPRGSARPWRPKRPRRCGGARRDGTGGVGLPRHCCNHRCGWTKSRNRPTWKPWLKPCLNPLFVGIYKGIILPGCLRWCRISSTHSRCGWSQCLKFWKIPTLRNPEPQRSGLVLILCLFAPR